MTSSMTLDRLQAACREDAAIRYIARLQPAGGEGDKVFPPTYEGGEYALESRVVDGRRVPCVLLDSVQSQANRMESALLDAHRAKRLELPLITVDFVKQGLPEVGVVTSLDAPHRMADAILRDSTLNGVPFRKSPIGNVLDTASLANAAELFAVCPTALLFGLWDSAGPRGGLGTKFARAIVGEVVAFDIEVGKRPSSRLDPLGIQGHVGEVYQAKATHAGLPWTLDPALANSKGGKPIVFKEKGQGKPSEINHGNVTPSLKNEKGQPHHGGVTFAYARQSIVISLSGLRKLRFPIGAETNEERDLAGRTVLAALGLCASTLATHLGGDLRSRCALVADAGHPARTELVHGDGMVELLTVSADDALLLFLEAVAAAKKLGLPWHNEPIELVPHAELVRLVKQSRELAMQSSGEE